MNGYIAFYGDQPQFEVYAETTYAAKLKALEHFKPPKSKKHLVTVHLAETNGETVTHVADF